MDSGRHVNSDPRRALPSIDRLVSELERDEPEIPRWAVSEGVRLSIALARESLSQGADAVRPRVSGDDPERANAPGGEDGDASGVWRARALAEARRLSRVGPRRVINATGIVLHTNLGRAPLAPGAARAAAEAASGHCALELDLATGRRGQRLAALEEKLCLLSGAEAAFACNNNAGALMLALGSLAPGREVLVSRGELVEIGGSFRVPEIMQRSGVRLVEVGSTNRTHARDYERAIGPDTGLLLKVHRSNFEQQGFVKEVDLARLAEIGRAHDLPVVEDLGSGTLIDLRDFGFPDESYACDRLRRGADVVCFSGDKLLGGPQAGLILGSQRALEPMRTNPLARALRLDKMTLAALDWTLARLLDGSALRELPVLRQLLCPIDDLEERTSSLAQRLRERFSDSPHEHEFTLTRARTPVGGGSLPGFELESCLLGIRARCASSTLARRLRERDPAVIARVRDDILLVDLRAVEGADLSQLESALAGALEPD